MKDPAIFDTAIASKRQQVRKARSRLIITLVVLLVAVGAVIAITFSS